MKITKEELKEEFWILIIGVGLLLLLIILFGDFFKNNPIFSIIIFLMFFGNYGIILIHERKYTQNFPYKSYKSRKKIWKRILMGLLAGLHYLFFIGSYDHKKYNTQVYYPETVECFWGNVSQSIVLFGYIFISVKLFESFGYYSLIIMIIPIITNIISIKKY